MPRPNESAAISALDDSELLPVIARGDHAAFEELMRRHNGKLFRVARAIVRDDVEAEDVLQDAYVDAYRHVDQFRGGSRVATWLTRIVINQALVRLRKRKQERMVVPFTRQADDQVQLEAEIADEKSESPPAAILRAEIRRILEQRIDELPDAFRTVFVMRDIEDMSVHETAECLGIPPATVRTRLFRARALLRAALDRDLDAAAADAFGFAGERCDRIVAAVLTRVSALPNN
jgi:RNA polymerase sigma-70 factor, ECF subfamily